LTQNGARRAPNPLATARNSNFTIHGRIRAQIQSKSVSVSRRVLPCKRVQRIFMFFCYILATQILHFLELFSINFATTGQHFSSEFKFTNFSPFNCRKQSPAIQCNSWIRSLSVHSIETDTKTQNRF
jgi:hypothetical protein